MVDSKAVAAQGTAQAAALRAAIAAFDELPQFQYIQQLGKGTFGVVALAKHVSRGDLVAIKLVPRAHVNPNVDNREIAILRSLRHHHVIRFKEMHLTTRFVAIVMEYASGGDLLTLVSSRGPLAEPDARCVPRRALSCLLPAARAWEADPVLPRRNPSRRWFFQQLIIALDYCHREGVVNRDIKLENTLLQPQQNHPNRPFLKLCDFGLAKVRCHAACLGAISLPPSPALLARHPSDPFPLFWMDLFVSRPPSCRRRTRAWARRSTWRPR